ncbi:hypothetical protein CesoFtcFv8_018583 [Champsocephalus esox]|uniref:Uncharacterized protein n=1 Tax=Champsocephalus esox TaxID=159716 RepID=A0AAN8GP84_9TELE|nr:hypothetical protein CesoFtcFv8_018583 [Champsocephalus esox]
MSCSYLSSGNPFSRLGPGALTDRDKNTAAKMLRAPNRPPPAALKGPATTRPSRAGSSHWRLMDSHCTSIIS